VVSSWCFWTTLSTRTVESKDKQIPDAHIVGRRVVYSRSCKVMSAYLRHFYGVTTACMLKGRKPRSGGAGKCKFPDWARSSMNTYISSTSAAFVYGIYSS